MIGIYDINDFKNIDFRIRLETYKKVGFSSIGLYIDDKYMNKNENYENIIKFAIKIGLQVNQVHVDYKISNEICENTQKYLDYVEEKLLFCKKYEIKNMVLHASKGSNPPKVNDDQLKKLISLAKRFPEVNLSFENVRNNYNLEKILNLNQPNITLCYDIGHANAYNSSYLLNKYKNKISCAHLHNNYGNDDHNLLSNGNINYRKVINILASINCDCCLEVFPDKNFPQTMDFFVNFISRAYDDYIWRNWIIRKTNFKNHALNLQPTYFNLIKNKEKTLEGRLNDEKRKHYVKKDKYG